MVNPDTFETAPPASAVDGAGRIDDRPQQETGATFGDQHALQTGTTTVALTAGDGVVVAADQRASLGGQFTANKQMEKIAQVHDRGAVALSGTVGPLQDFARTLRAESSLYAATRGEPMPASALATVAGRLVRGVPAQILLGGIDDDGAHVYELDGGGGVVPTDYGAAGSGMQVAYGTLEGHAESVDDVDDARDLALQAVAAASERDTASGNGATVATITTDGVSVDSHSRSAVTQRIDRPSGTVGAPEAPADADEGDGDGPEEDTSDGAEDDDDGGDSE